MTAYGDFGKRSNFQVDGDLVNSGALYALSSNKHRHDGILIRAANTDNQAGALISSMAPADNTFDNGHTGRFADSDLILHADGDLTNSGTIRSGSNLTLSAPAP